MVFSIEKSSSPLIIAMIKLISSAFFPSSTNLQKNMKKNKQIKRFTSCNKIFFFYCTNKCLSKQSVFFWALFRKREKVKIVLLEDSEEWSILAVDPCDVKHALIAPSSSMRFSKNKEPKLNFSFYSLNCQTTQI